MENGNLVKELYVRMRRTTAVHVKNHCPPETPFPYKGPLAGKESYSGLLNSHFYVPIQLQIQDYTQILLRFADFYALLMYWQKSNQDGPLASGCLVLLQVVVLWLPIFLPVIDVEGLVSFLKLDRPSFPRGCNVLLLHLAGCTTLVPIVFSMALIFESSSSVMRRLHSINHPGVWERVGKLCSEISTEKYPTAI